MLKLCIGPAFLLLYTATFLLKKEKFYLVLIDGTSPRKQLAQEMGTEYYTGSEPQ